MPRGVRWWGRKWMIKKGSGVSKPMTHLLLDGGVLSVPNESEEFFLRKLSYDIKDRTRNYVVELRTPVYKYLADLDIFEKKPKKISVIKEWIKEMLIVLRQFYPDYRTASIFNTKLVSDKIKPKFLKGIDQLTVLVCTTEPKLGAIKYGKEYAKVGVHLIFPWLCLDTSTALKLRSAFIQHFYKIYGERPEGTNEWEDVFDHTVYTSNGLRMVGCAKIVKCSVCKPPFKIVPGKKRVCPSDLCNGWGKIDVGRIYEVSGVFNGDGTSNNELLKELQSNIELMVKVTSIRIKELNDPHLPTAQPEWYNEDEMIQVNVKTKSSKKKVIKVPRKGLMPSTIPTIEGGFKDEDKWFEKTKGQYKKVKLPLGDDRMEAIKEWIGEDSYIDRYLVHSRYRDVNVTDIVMVMPDIGQRYYLVGVDSHYCQNLQSTHSSNTIYFVINKIGMFQKCFCRCNTIEHRKSGKKCADYTSYATMIPKTVFKQLFPDVDIIKEKVNNLYSSNRTGLNDRQKIFSILNEQLKQ